MVGHCFVGGEWAQTTTAGGGKLMCIIGGDANEHTPQGQCVSALEAETKRTYALNVSRITWSAQKHSIACNRRQNNYLDTPQDVVHDRQRPTDTIQSQLLSACTIAN